MKKFLAISLWMLYMLSSSGAALKAHYCHGKLSSVKIVVVDKDDCCCSKKKANRKCCSDKLTFCKAIDSHQAASATQSVTSQHDFADLLPVLELFYAFSSDSAPAPLAASSYPDTGRSIYLSNGVLRL
jgi:hypothetical protein